MIGVESSIRPLVFIETTLLAAVNLLNRRDSCFNNSPDNYHCCSKSRSCIIPCRIKKKDGKARIVMIAPDPSANLLWTKFGTNSFGMQLIAMKRDTRPAQLITLAAEQRWCNALQMQRMQESILLSTVSPVFLVLLEKFICWTDSWCLCQGLTSCRLFSMSGFTF